MPCPLQRSRLLSCAPPSPPPPFAPPAADAATSSSAAPSTAFKMHEASSGVGGRVRPRPPIRDTVGASSFSVSKDAVVVVEVSKEAAVEEDMATWGTTRYYLCCDLYQ